MSSSTPPIYFFKDISPLSSDWHYFSWEVGHHLFFFGLLFFRYLFCCGCLWDFLFILWCLVFDYNVPWCAWDLLAFLDLCFYSFLQIWKGCGPYFFKYFLCLSFSPSGLQLHVYLATWSFFTSHWFALIFLNSFFSVFNFHIVQKWS